MKGLNNFCQNILNKFCQQGISDRANFLKNIAVIGWILSSLAQTCAVIFNDKIPSKEKRFLVPQEIFDGLANATLFWFITSKATDFGKKLILKKIVLPKSLVNVMNDFTTKAKDIPKLKEKFLAHIKKYGTKENLKTAEMSIEGMGVLSGITGAIFANNIITPIVRNKLAGICQKKEMDRVKENAPLNPYYGNVNINTVRYLIDLYQVYMYCFAIK